MFGFAAFVSFPITVGAPPKKSEPFAVRKQFAMRLTIYFTVVSFSLLGAAFCATLILRRVRREYAQRSLENFADLLTAEIHEKKPNA